MKRTISMKLLTGMLLTMLAIVGCNSEKKDQDDKKKTKIENEEKGEKAEVENEKGKLMAEAETLIGTMSQEELEEAAKVLLIEIATESDLDKVKESVKNGMKSDLKQEKLEDYKSVSDLSENAQKLVNLAVQILEAKDSKENE